MISKQTIKFDGIEIILRTNGEEQHVSISIGEGHEECDINATPRFIKRLKQYLNEPTEQQSKDL
jgi:hypothetical protein